MNNPDLSTVAAGQIRDQMKQAIEQEFKLMGDIAQAATWIRDGAPAKALEVLERILNERHTPGPRFRQEDEEPPESEAPAHDGVNCGCKSFDDCPGR